MRGELALATVVLAGCGFDARLGAADAAVDAPRDVPADARMCPAPPPDCTRFACASSTSCYYACGDATPGSKRSWPAARTACSAVAGACLVTIDDQAEQTCIVQAAVPSFPMTNWIWIGYHQPPGTGEPLDGWQWACPTSTFTLPPWGDGSGEPDENGDEDCAALTTGGGWFDATCGDTARYLCELP